MQTTDVMFGEWLPSAPSYKSPGCLVADNVIPTPGGGYGPQPGLQAQETPITGGCRGAAQFFAQDGTSLIVGGAANRLFTIRGGVVTETTGLTGIGSGESWDFAQFNNIVVATSAANAPQYLSDIESDDAWSDLPGSPPLAKHCARVEDFLMLGNLVGFPNRIQWSSFNSPGGDWTPARLTQAGYADLPLAFGPVQKIVGGRFPMVFQERGVSRLEYIGPPVVWRASEVEQARGALAPHGVLTVGFVTYFLAQDGFWATDGSSFQPIGTARINRWFFDRVDAATIQETHGAIDWANECVVWAFREKGATGPNRLLRYSWAENRWSSATVGLSRLVEVAFEGLSLEQIGALYATLEEVPASLDDARWSARLRGLGAFVDDGATSDVHGFSAAPLAAQIETGEFQPQPGRRVFTAGARVLGDGGEVWKAAAATTQNDRSLTYSAHASAGVDGKSPLRADGMTLRLSLVTDEGAEWRNVIGAQTSFRISGGR